MDNDEIRAAFVRLETLLEAASEAERRQFAELGEKTAAVRASVHGLEARVIDLEHRPLTASERQGVIRITVDGNRPVREFRVIYVDDVDAEEVPG